MYGRGEGGGEGDVALGVSNGIVFTHIVGWTVEVGRGGRC